MEWAGYRQKNELHNWGNVPGFNVWTVPATGDSRSLGDLLQRAKLLRILSCVIHPSRVTCVMGPGRATLPRERK